MNDRRIQPTIRRREGGPSENLRLPPGVSVVGPQRGVFEGKPSAIRSMTYLDRDHTPHWKRGGEDHGFIEIKFQLSDRTGDVGGWLSIYTVEQGQKSTRVTMATLPYEVVQLLRKLLQDEPG